MTEGLELCMLCGFPCDCGGPDGRLLFGEVIRLEPETVTARRATVWIGDKCLLFGSVNRRVKSIGRFPSRFWPPRDQFNEARKMAARAMRKCRRQDREARSRQLRLEPLLVPAMASQARPLCV